ADRDGGSHLGWEGSAWLGGDVRKLWLRSEGHAALVQVVAGDIEVLYGQGVRAWEDVLVVVRDDLGEDPDPDWLAVGVERLAPFQIEVAATVYLGERGRTAARLEVEYDTLLSQRMVLQWRAEAEAHGKADLARGIGAGLGTVEAGLRLRYEITRQFAPYIGFERTHAFGGTADLRRAAGTPVADDRLVAGVRIWF